MSDTKEMFNVRFKEDGRLIPRIKQEIIGNNKKSMVCLKELILFCSQEMIE